MKTFLMQPRQTGKTTKVICEFLKDSKNNLLILYSQERVNFIKSTYPELEGNKNIISAEIFSDDYEIDGIFNRNYNLIIIDDYLFCPNLVDIYIKLGKLSNLFNGMLIASTPNRRYNRGLFNIVKRFKEDDVVFNKLLFIDYSNDRSMNDFCDLFYNFLTDSDTVIIDNISYHEGDKYKVEPDYFSKDQYELEILNRYLTK
jgi:hypothetical protein